MPASCSSATGSPRPREATATDIAHAAMEPDTDAFAPAGAERFRQGRHESEYFDPARPVDKTAADARWAVELAGRAIAAVELAGRAIAAVEPAISTG